MSSHEAPGARQPPQPGTGLPSHWPVAGLQATAMHGSLLAHVTPPYWHWPPTHWSTVHRLPSPQLAALWQAAPQPGMLVGCGLAARRGRPQIAMRLVWIGDVLLGPRAAVAVQGQVTAMQGQEMAVQGQVEEGRGGAARQAEH